METVELTLVVFSLLLIFFAPPDSKLSTPLAASIIGTLVIVKTIDVTGTLINLLF